MIFVVPLRVWRGSIRIIRNFTTKKNRVPEALKRNKERKFTKKKKCQKLKVKYQVAVYRKLV